MKMVQHPAYEGPRKRLRMALDRHRPGHMVFIIGPSGVGKTTMRRSVMQEMFGNPACWDCGRIPLVETFATLPHGAYFSSRQLAVSILQELHAPTLAWLLDGSYLGEDAKLRIRRELAAATSEWASLARTRQTEGEYWGMVQRSLRARSCKYVSIDQVTALLVNHRDKSPADHTLHLMAIAEATGVMFVMTGVHKATQLWSVNSELRRRVTTIWVPPYSDRRRDDKLPFLRLLKSLANRYGLSQDDLLIRMANDILAATGGVFAEVVELLERADIAAKQEGCSRILKRHIEISFYGSEDLRNLWRDIDAFEMSMVAGSVTERSEHVKARWGSPT
ncbi:ATP-binding protein [Stenotrophomonas maltophilia]|uniref:AAA family ATPase n=1 Tax=Stenotrophomonas TaxID=40323 RepID=UPI0015DD8DCC|nr:MULTISPECIES: AAA family ATPase [Stenotrophomonas]MBA0259933.1 ATP-binding protein [Stenotrophomonas maltophilia]MBB1136406.1 ATP-binding protein [Stenotrophomonas sp. I18B00994]MCU1095129.1 ATP-binding protein [Stenotrophomonas maltophilia]HEI8113697.1 ATP-binding protein [Stenotrophomonas maltophilia]HEL4834599.1 ATP-binding protein [Stenotrophomonas maltophilia]